MTESDTLVQQCTFGLELIDIDPQLESYCTRYYKPIMPGSHVMKLI